MRKTILRFALGMTFALSAIIVAKTDVMANTTAGMTAALTDCIRQSRGRVVSPTDVAITRSAMGDTDRTVSMTAGLGTDVADADRNVVVNENTGKKTFYGYEVLGVANVDSYLNVRKKPSEESDLAGKMPPGSGCEILGVENGFYHIKSGKVKGYVSCDYLLTGDDAIMIAPNKAKTMATVNTTTLYVRSEPNTDCSIITMVPIDEELVVLEEMDGWCKIELDDEEGYVSSEYVTLSDQLPKAITIKALKKKENPGVSDTRVELVQFALKWVGNRYVWGGESLEKGVDCSGFTMRVYEKFGIKLPHHAASQAGYGTKVTYDTAKPGDLFFYGSGSRIGHVAIYIGNGQIVHASNAREGIKISNVGYRTPLKVISLLSQ